MKEHDFRKMAYAIKNLHSVPVMYGEVVYALKEAYSAGLERAAEIVGGGLGLTNTRIIAAIRAEKEADHG